jgi:DNA-binding NtrC family response regulator
MIPVAEKSIAHTPNDRVCATFAAVGNAETAAPGRSVVLVIMDSELSSRLASSLTRSRWRVHRAQGGAEAMMLLHRHDTDAMVLDRWLPDLEVGEFAAHVRLLHPSLDLVRMDGVSNPPRSTARSARHSELLHAIRDSIATDSQLGPLNEIPHITPDISGKRRLGRLPGLIGSSDAMREVAALVEMVAPRNTPVLIEGETGTGKEVVARALHRLSQRAARPFVVLNCAAIPESLLEAELFGHARGAFTGAVQSRIGRIESAHGGTLLLDEIGEMPLAMQSKMLRFIESGELQKVGENEVVRVDVRLIAATHQPLEQRATEGTFRLDLYHRLAVFPIDLPPLRDRRDDISELAEYFLERMGNDSPRKRLTPEAQAMLAAHSWPGNVRELMHVLERAAILAGTNPQIAATEIRYRRRPRVSHPEPI